MDHYMVMCGTCYKYTGMFEYLEEFASLLKDIHTPVLCAISPGLDYKLPLSAFLVLDR